MTENNLIPRGTDRVRRRAQQEQAKVLGEQELVKLTAPKSPERDAARAEAREKAVVRQERPPQTIRKAAQAANAAKAEAESAAVASVPENTGPLAGFRPGQQVDHITARNFMKRHGRVSKDRAMTAAKAAGSAVLNTLRGKDQPISTKPTRFRKRAQHAAATAAAKKQG